MTSYYSPLLMIFICTAASVRASWHHSGHLATKKFHTSQSSWAVQSKLEGSSQSKYPKNKPSFLHRHGWWGIQRTLLSWNCCYQCSIWKPFGTLVYGTRVEITRFAVWPEGNMTGRPSEMVETLFRWRVDICCVQDCRWRGCGVSESAWKGRCKMRFLARLLLSAVCLQ